MLARLACCSLLLLAVHLPLAAQDTDGTQTQDLKRLTLEELTQVEVTSASRRPERVARTAAAVSVIRQDDIHRSGTTTLAEALRLGDAIDVAQVNGNTWGVSARGFNISTANKLLVLIDGRSTYVPLFGGTFWDVQDTILPDIERIEIIRGPGGATWGANAVNGVVNVISKSAAETQGSQLVLLGGTNERAVVSARHGGRAGEGHYRLYAKFRHMGPQLLQTGGSAGDDTALGQAGFRYDSSAFARTRWFVSGAGYRGSFGLLGREDGSTSGGHVLGRVTRTTGRAGEFVLQAYYDRSERDVPLQFHGTRDTGELDVQQSWHAGRHALIVGSTIRASHARDTGSGSLRFDPERLTSWTFNAFVQDEYEIVPDRAYLLAGAKAGRNNHTGFELQPSVRVRLQGGDRQMGWAAVSRAVRLPTRFDTDLQLLGAGGSPILTGSEEFDAESVVAFEGGYRALVHPRVSVDVAAFTNRYDDLRSQEHEGLIVLRNLLNATTSGVEVAATIQPAAAWRLHGSYAWFTKSLSLDPGSTDVTGGAAEGNDPSHLAGLRSQLDVTPTIAFDALLRHVGRRPAPLVPGYTELDLRVGWTLQGGVELSMIGQNLLNAAHAELSSGATRERIRRAVVLRSIWRF